MKRITCLLVLLFLVVQTSFAQDKHSRIKITNPSQQTINTIASQGIDLRCGSRHEDKDLILELSSDEINLLSLNNISYTIEIDDLTQFYSKRAERDLPLARTQLNAAKASAFSNAAERSISSVVMDNIIQYAECDEIDFVEPQNFNLGSMAGCLTFQEMKNELDEMYTFSQTNSLDIVSQKANASPTGQKTWGNPTNNFVNQQNNGPATYSGVGSTRWDPETIWYVRITGNQSTTSEGSKPQMLFTSMIHSREVSALMNNIYFMWYIIENYGSDPAITELVDNNELYFVPVVNPDGLRWNETLSPGGGGLQRKNLRPNIGGTGYSRGVDLNRNFDYFWAYNNIGSSGIGTNNGAASDYRGPAPESEPETQIMVDFITSRNIKSAVWNHSFANSVPHPYGGVPTASTGREDEYYKWHEEMTRYNRYLYGATIFYESNGLPDDWMMGGAPDNNGSTGSGQAIIATTPEHGGQGFWPTPTTIVPIAKQSMRISLATAYYGGKYAKLHDLTQSNVTSLTADLDFGIERIGQTASDFTVTVTPISSNIASITSPATESGMAVLTQRTVTATLNLNPTIGDNEKIEYNVTLSNDDGVIYEANYEKYYQPTATVTPLFAHDPDASGLTGWTQSGGWTTTTSDAYSGTTSISTGTYSSNATKTLTTTNSFDFSNSNEVLIQFYTKWDIERNYDFVEVLGSPDGGTNWISLCGNYTKPNATSATTSHDNKSSTYANFQNNSAGQIYDGDRLDHWVMEEITIDGTYASLLNSNNVRIRFNFRTDALNVNENYTTTNDGFFIDDFKIISVQIPCQTTLPTNVSVSNITTLTAQIDWDAIPSATYDIRYRETGSGPTGWTTITDLATNSYLISGLTPTTDYDVQVRTRCVTSTSAYTTITNFTTAAPVPCTGNSVSSYPYSENFESNIGLWTQTTDDDIDWTRDSAGTPSANTGPSTGDGDTFYMYTEASGAAGFPSKVANFVSPCFDLTGKDNIQFTYSYHMYGQFIGSLRLQVSTDNGASYQTLDEYTTNLGNTWNQKTTDLSAYKDQVIKLRFNAITGSDPTSGWGSDIAIDNINVTADEAGSAPPTAVCQNITVQLDTAGNATIVASDVDGGSTDDIAITNYSIDIDTFNCSNIGTPVDVTLTVTDGDSQTDTCIATVTVVDQVNPEFVNVPGDIDLTCGNNQPTWTDPTATDNCDTTLTVVRTDGTGLNSGDTFPAGTTVISYSVTDDSGNTNTASFNVNVIVDNQNPTAVCQNISIQLDATGNATITASAINNGSSDNCGIASISASQTAFTCADEGTNNVTLTVTDTNGNTDTCIAVVTVTLQDAPTGLECWETATYNYTTCAWEITGTQPAEPATACYETATFDTDDSSPTYCTWVISGTQPAEPATACWETASFDNDDTSPTYCTWVITGTQPVEPTAINCWDDYQFNTILCVWENQGTQPVEPVTACYETAIFDTDNTSPTYCTWVITGTQPAEPETECWETATFDTDDTSPTYCTWVVTGTQPVEPTATNCWDDYQFNSITCAWENQGIEPTEPVTECWETATFDTDDTSPTYCTWVITGTQPVEPTAINCWDDYQFNSILCAWENQGTEPVEPTTQCWETATFDSNDTSPTYCTWVVTGTQPAEPTTECWETATFDTDDTSPTYCTWVVTGTQPVEPTAINCWDDYQFNSISCAWENQGVEPVEPTTACWETATFDNDDTSPTYCTWVITGTQPVEPVAVNCWDDYQFNSISCAWENQGAEPIEPTTACWETATFDNDDTSPTYCTWVVTGAQPAEPTTECWETAIFDNDDTSPTYCTWVITGTQPAEPTTECWETATFDADDTSPTYCTWVVTGTQPVEPPAINCWDDYQFNSISCTWENQGIEPVEPTTECWEIATFDLDDTSPTYCSWVVTGTQPVEPTAECWETASFDSDEASPTYCSWVITGTQPVEPTATNCWDDYQFNIVTCTWENQGSQPIAPSGLIAVSITDSQATINWDTSAGLTYDLRYREVGSSIWIDILDMSTNTQNLTGLTPLTQYVVQVRSKCSIQSLSAYSTAIDFTTLDTVLNYCGSASNNANEEYISRVQLNTIDNTSGSQAYSDFTSISTSLTEGEQYTISITPTWTGTVYNEAYSVWIDFNRDGDFDDAGEQVFTQGNTQATLITGSFTIPTGTSRQQTRMRVSMKYNALPTPCETFAFGEVEDYSVILYGSDDLIYSNSAWTPYAPSPTTVTENAIVLDGTYTVTDNVQINNIRVTDGAGIIIEKSKSIIVNGDMVTNDNVILESDSDEYSSLIVNNIVIGKALYKRHVNTTASVGGNDLIAPPVYGESFIDFRAANPNILSNTANTLFLFGPFDKLTDTYVLYTNTEIASLNAGIGYRAASTDNGTFTFNGLVETENVSVPIVNDGPTNPEWNLVGNPYPSYIKLSDFLLANSSKFTLENAGIYGYDGYASDGWTIWNQAYSDANPDAIITPGQGFLIASAANNGQINFTRTMRRIGNADDFILGRNTEIKHLQLQLDNSQEGTYKTDFYFTNNASNGMDFNYDASIYGEQAPSDFALYSHLLEENTGLDLAIQSLGFDALSGAVIPLGVHFPQGQQITLSISESDLPENIEVYLEDTLNNTFTLLNSGDYIITPNENLNTIGRYYLRFNEETLSTHTNTRDDLKIYTTTQPKALFVKGQLLQNSELSIYDLQGRLIKRIALDNSQNTYRIDVSNLSSGSYIVSLENDVQKKTQKVVIN